MFSGFGTVTDNITSIRSTHPELAEFVDDMMSELSEELASSIGLGCNDTTTDCLLFNELDSATITDWEKGFECLLTLLKGGSSLIWHFNQL
ncbi:hypothetical protein BLNAU_1744 [Blattamonas nauphoetae]|uniref:Uncharacterized protein n=1 Tax=Blattamonas nauphoetae TaxID=2049346 RepID=A0ABQ9YHG6_9EUKA|nr:hypothetical protein BLNAU_1744 [Blattamonas nauphoetae]